MQVGCERGRGLALAYANQSANAGRAQALDAASGDPRIGIQDADDDARDAGREQAVDARRRPTVVRARLEADERGGAPRAFAGGGDGEAFGVWAASAAVVALADDLAVAHEDTADPRVGRRGRAAALG